MHAVVGFFVVVGLGFCFVLFTGLVVCFKKVAKRKFSSTESKALVTGRALPWPSCPVFKLLVWLSFFSFQKHDAKPNCPASDLFLKKQIRYKGQMLGGFCYYLISACFQRWNFVDVILTNSFC